MRIPVRALLATALIGAATLLSLAPAAQTYATLFARERGMMIGAGELWFGGTCSDPACQQPWIIAINP